MESIIKLAKMKNLEIIEEFNNQYVDFCRELDPTIKKEKVEYHNIKKCLKQKGGQFLVIEVDKQIVGCCFAEIRKHYDWSINEKVGEIHFMFVKKKFRGNQLAVKLIQSCMDWFDENRIKEIRIGAYANNKHALDLYRKFGFKEYAINLKIIK
ncbi:MAG: GNAT family N-acetyltransferase [Nanoarchaeales archaeon]|nr:GNAT family N-acetyltransferase [Nanoarchaeales archaeon]